MMMPMDTPTVFMDYLDFSASWRAAAVLTVPEMKRPDEWHDRRRCVEVTAPFLQGHPEVSLYRLSELFPSAANFRASKLFKEFMRPGGWDDSMGMVFRNGPSVRSVISLRRRADGGSYCPEETRLLELLHPHLEAVLDRVLQRTDEHAQLT